MPRRPRRWLRRLWWAAVALVVLLCAAYFHVTDPDRLRESALAALRNLHIDGVELDTVTFAPGTGLELHGLVIAPPAPGDGDPEGGEARAGTDETRPGEPSAHVPTTPRLDGSRGLPTYPALRLRVGSAQLDCGSLALLLGRIRPSAVTLRDVTLTIICDPAAASGGALAADAQAQSRAAWNVLADRKHRLPRLTLTNGDLRVMVVDRGRPRLLERLRFGASGQATVSGYELRIERPVPTAPPLVEALWDAATGELRVAGDRADLDVVAQLLPQRMAEALGRLKPVGRVRVERLVLATGSAAAATGGSAGPQLAQADVRVADAAFSVPVETTDAETEVVRNSPAHLPANPFVRLSGATADITYRLESAAAPGELRVAVAGVWNDAPVTLSLDLAGSVLHRLQAGPEQLAGAFTLDDVLQAELRVAGLELPTAQTHPAFVRCPRLPHAVVAALREYEPRGKVNLRVTILPAGSGAGPRVESDIEALGNTCRYFRFPYTFREARGHLRYVQGRLVFDGVTGRHGPAALSVNGVVNSTASWSGLNLTFGGRNVALDRELYAALPENYRRLWESAAPIGLCDISTAISRPDGTAETGAQPAAVDVQARLLGGSLSLGDGQRLDHVEGQISAQNDVIQIRNLHGYQGATAVRLDGNLHMLGGHALADLDVELADLPIDHTAALAPGLSGVSPELRLEGRADVWGRVTQTGDGTGRRDCYAVHIKDGVLAGRDPGRGWTDARGWVTVQGALRRIAEFTCRQGAARFAAAGVLPQGGPAAPPSGSPTDAVDLEVRATAPALESLPAQFLPPEWLRVTDALALTGEGGVRVRLRRAPGTEGTVGPPGAEITVNAARAKPLPLPLELREVAGRVTLTAERFEVAEARARWGAAGQIEATGGGVYEAGRWQADFTVAARELSFEPELIAALPGPLSRLLERLSPRGHFDVLLSQVRVAGSQPSTWELRGSLPLRDVSLHLGLDLAVTEGELTGVATIGADREVAVDADFVIGGGRLGGRPIARWEGRLRRPLGERWVYLDELRGRLCDGEVLGGFQVDPESGAYQLSLTLYDVDAAGLLPGAPRAAERRLRGRVDGHVYLRGASADASARRGGGEVRIRGASFLQTPLLASLARAGRPSEAVVDDMVDQAEVRFLLEGDEVRITRIGIRSRDLRLIGEGTFSLRDDALRLTLVGAHPENWPRVAVLSDLLESAGQRLVQYRVSGTLSAPQVATEPLHELNEALRRLLRENAE